MVRDVAFTVSDILWLLSAIGVIFTVWKFYKELKKPNDEFHATVEDHEVKLDRDFKRLNEIESGNRVLCNCMLALLDQQLTGNGKEQMQKAKEDLQKYLVNK